MQLPNIKNNNLLPIYLFVSLLMILTGCVHPEKNTLYPSADDYMGSFMILHDLPLIC